MKRYQRSVEKWLTPENALWDILRGANLKEHPKTPGKSHAVDTDGNQQESQALLSGIFQFLSSHNQNKAAV